MNGPHVGVLPVVEGSIVWLHNISLAAAGPKMPGDDPFDLGGELVAGLIDAVGHQRFVVLCTEGDGIVDVLGPEDLVARVRAALTPEGEPS